MALKSPPVDGKANAELIKWIARKLGVPKSAVRIVSGQSGRRKMVDIEGVDAEKVRRELFGGGSSAVVHGIGYQKAWAQVVEVVDSTGPGATAPSPCCPRPHRGEWLGATRVGSDD